MTWYLVRNREVVDARDALPDSWGGLSQLTMRTLDELQRFGIYQGVPDAAPQGFDPDGEQLDVTPAFDVATNVVRERFIRRALPPGVALRLRCKTVLAATQWTVLADSPLLTAGKAAWTTYRAAIRALPNNTADPSNVTWPTPPPTRGELD